MKDIYKCTTCGVVAEASEQVCVPDKQSDMHDYCGTTGKRAAMCDSMKEHVAFVCGTCGRPAEQADLVCKPLVTG